MAAIDPKPVIDLFEEWARREDDPQAKAQPESTPPQPEPKPLWLNPQAPLDNAKKFAWRCCSILSAC